ncbi:MAG: UDP-3-O-(3-hydroxymyristoyl)glucosamine N-acyltransferase [Rhodobacteraceae bacterium]|nr:UDP-3-O-(3-hydroxymyristoyl)glucosamine N-acyltransferase [Paracoccaceae bacterium]
MSFTLSEIARALGAEALGNGALIISGVAEPQDAGSGDIALAIDKKFADALSKGQAKSAVLWEGADWQELGLEGAICVGRGAAAMAGLTQMMDAGPDIVPGIHTSAVIDDSAIIGPGASVGPFVVIGADVVIGENARIAPHVSIARGARIGVNCLLHTGVRICAGVEIGANFICQPNATIGGDGFSFKTIAEKSAVEELRRNISGKANSETPVSGSSHWARVHSLGNVVIGDDVEVGSNTSIDRGTIRATRIGRGTKIDNQVQIGHNCEIGEDCLICGACSIAGSVKMGDRVVMGGLTGVADNIFIGDDVITGGRTTIFSNVPGGRVVWGTPAVRLETQMAINKEMRRLPRLAEQIRKLNTPTPGFGKKD